MNTCKYHPLSPATYKCRRCFTFNCDNCIDEGDGHSDEVCFQCSLPVEHLGAVNQAVPFWRRLEESFRYPLNVSTTVFIVIMSFLTTIVGFIPFAFIGYLILTGIFLKYCFSCLESTAGGLFIPPDVTESYSGGLALIGKLLGMLFVMGVVVYYANRFVGPQAAIFIVFLMAVALPAIFIIFGMTDDLVEALNPMSIFRLITSIGLPYGLILAFIMIMSASVGVIQSIIGYDYSVITYSLQAVVSNYYMIVMFHIMGYTIFQYQGKLGFTAREDLGEGRNYRSDRDRLAAKLSVTLKEGNYNEVVKLFDAAIKKNPNDKDFNKQYFEFLYASKRTQVIAKAATRYLTFLVRNHQEHQLTVVYKRVLQQDPNYKPDSAKLRHYLAQACKEGGDSISAVKLINGLHKEYPDYAELIDAYELMADALDDIPHKQEQARKCRLLVEHMKKVKPKEVEKTAIDNSLAIRKKEEDSAKQTTNKKGRAVFGVDDESKKPKFEPEPVKDIEPGLEDSSTSKDLPPIEFKL